MIPGFRLPFPFHLGERQRAAESGLRSLVASFASPEFYGFQVGRWMPSGIIPDMIMRGRTVSPHSHTDHQVVIYPY